MKLQKVTRSFKVRASIKKKECETPLGDLQSQKERETERLKKYNAPKRNLQRHKET